MSDFHEVECRVQELLDGLNDHESDTSEAMSPEDVGLLVGEVVALLKEQFDFANNTSVELLFSSLFKPASAVHVLLLAGAKENMFADAKIQFINFLCCEVFTTPRCVLYIEPHLVAIKDSLAALFMAGPSNKLKASVIKALTMILQLSYQAGKIDEMATEDLVELMFSRILRKTAKSDKTATVLLHVYEFLGVMCHLCPAQMQQHANGLKLTMLSDLRSQLESKLHKVEQSTMAGCIKGFDGYLTNFGNGNASLIEAC